MTDILWVKPLQVRQNGRKWKQIKKEITLHFDSGVENETGAKAEVPVVVVKINQPNNSLDESKTENDTQRTKEKMRFFQIRLEGWIF